ncbi:MAG: LysR family transcriptional regulator [Terrimicrobiaceae bacterium]
MEIHQLRYFVAVAEEGSFSRAAERMRVAQPSLSQQIQKLEQEIGQRLFDRLARGVTPTAAGAGLLPFARKILNDLADARRCVEEHLDMIGGTVTAGIIPTIAPYVLGPLLVDFEREYPQIAVRAVEDVTENLIRLLEVGEIDVAVVSTCRSGAGLHRELWAREPLLVALPKEHRLAGRQRLSWRDLSKETLLTLQESHCLSRQISQWCRRHDVRLQKSLPLVQLSTVLAMVASHQGISLVPTLATSHESRPQCVFVALTGSAPTREINAVRNPARYQSKACAAFVELGQRVVRRLVASAAQVMAARPSSHRKDAAE